VIVNSARGSAHATRPSAGAAHGAVVLLYHRPAVPWFEDATTVTDHIESFARYSRFRVWQVNTDLGFPPGLAKVPVAAVVLHYSLFHSTGYKLDQGFRRFLASTDAYKVAFFQDEHHFCRQRFAFLNEYHFDCVFTCLEPSEFGKVYERYTSVPKLVSYLPGYVSETMVEAAERFALPDSERPIDIGYRGRSLAPYMGRGALEKGEIANRFATLAADSGLAIDVTAREGERLYGDDWWRFLGSCKGTLGVEAGVSVFDLNDEAYDEYRRLVLERPVSIEELEAGPQGRLEGNVYYRTASPRHFEAAAFGVCQILYEGRYSDVMEPGTHYIPLRKDFSNLGEVLEVFRDPEARRRITETARRDLIDSGAWTYERLVRDHFDCALVEEGLEPDLDAPTIESIDRALQAGERARRARTRLRWEWVRARGAVMVRAGRAYRRVRPSHRPRQTELAEGAE
jgi:Glycosyl transferases group 1